MDARRGITDRAFDLANGDDGFRLLGRGGGLYRRRRVVHAIRVGDGDGDDAELGPGARRLTAGDRRPPRDGIT